MAVPRLAPLVLSLAAAFPALAEELPSLEAVEVTAHRTDKSLAQTAPNAVVISRHKLDATLAEDMADAVKYEPGVEVASDPARRGNAGYTIRGIDGNRILMLVDGIRLPDAYAGGGNTNGFVSGRDYIDLDSLRAIDIVKGPFSSLYGSDAIGGVVGYRTLEVDDIVMPDERFGGGIKVFGASADESAGLTARLGVKGDTADAMLLVTRRQGHETGNQGHNDAQNTSRTKPNQLAHQHDLTRAEAQHAHALHLLGALLGGVVFLDAGQVHQQLGQHGERLAAQRSMTAGVHERAPLPLGQRAHFGEHA